MTATATMSYAEFVEYAASKGISRTRAMKYLRDMRRQMAADRELRIRQVTEASAANVAQAVLLRDITYKAKV